MKINIKAGGRTVSLEYKSEYTGGKNYWKIIREGTKDLINRAIDKVSKVVSIEIERDEQNTKLSLFVDGERLRPLRSWELRQSE
ncbi:MAG: hypothetical protein DDT23_00361 [candidate division WS2 bacterium]|nr:hypothetical protein [Candidatus Lithacetigena glycinireducens]